MHRRMIMAAGILAMLPMGASAQQATPAAGSAPLALVRSFYVRGYKQESLPLSRGLRQLFQAAMANSKKLGEPVPGIDFAWITGAQDEDANLRKTLKYKVLEETAASARVEASFVNGVPMTVTYAFIREANRWVVNDIAYLGEKATLTDLLREGAKAT